MKRSIDLNPKNKFLNAHESRVHEEGIDLDPRDYLKRTKFIDVYPKNVVNKVESPDVNMDYSLNPYQGCEHGCIYCYARNSHQFWGYSAGLDFEQNILIKKNAPQILENTLNKSGWKVKPITLSGNTDCYQPIERKLKITRSLLEVFLKYQHPLAIITKNALVERDLDILKPLAEHSLVRVIFSITTLDDNLRKNLEPRTSSIKKRLEALENLTKNQIPCGVMMAPIIPGLNSHEIMKLGREVSERGALSLGYTMLRLNEHLGELFLAWMRKYYPERVSKVIGHVKESHDGKVNDSRFGTRMKGQGQYAEMIHRSFQVARSRFFKGRAYPDLRTDLFKPNGQLNLFA